MTKFKKVFLEFFWKKTNDNFFLQGMFIKYDMRAGSFTLQSIWINKDGIERVKVDSKSLMDDLKY